jgi:hypothetical protein
MAGLEAALKGITQEQQLNAKGKLDQQIQAMELDRKNTLEEIKVLRDIKINNGIVNNMRSLVTRANREAERVVKIGSRPGTIGQRDNAANFVGQLSAVLKDLSDKTQMMNDSLDKDITMREEKIRAMGLQIQQMRKNFSQMRGNIVDDSSHLIEDIKQTFVH